MHFRRIWTFSITTALSVTLLSMLPVFAECCSCVGAATNNAGKKICLQISKGGCSTVKSDYKSNPGMNSVNCTNSLSDALCKTKAEGGACDEVAGAEAYNATNAEKTGDIQPLVAPNLAVQIPGLTFTTNPEIHGGVATIPFLQQYLSAAYKYLAGISVVAAAIMIVYGGMLYIAGASISSITSGKEKIRDAIAGLILVFGTFTILNVLNPNITKPTGLAVGLVSRQDASQDPVEESRRVQESARTKVQPNQVVPLVAPGAQAPGAPKPPVSTGTVVRNAKGEFVAQGSCPQDMLAIPYSDTYEQKLQKSAGAYNIKAHVDSFCMDVFEAPGVRGQKPFNGVENWEADWYCRASGKRLCSSSEWSRACLGPKGENTYGYGPTFTPGLFVSAEQDMNAAVKKGADTPGPCNYDTNTTYVPKDSIIHGLDFILKKSDTSFLQPSADMLADPKFAAKVAALKTELDKVTRAEPSGSRPLCVTSEGIYDMTGNVQEIVIRDDQAKLTTDQRVALGADPGANPYAWAGFYWSPIAHLANTKAKPDCLVRWGKGHGTTWRAWENGFRCCLDLQQQ